MLRHILLIVTNFNIVTHAFARSKTYINLHFLKYCQIAGNLSLYASTSCVMTHRWRVVTRDRDYEAHCNLNCLDIKRLISTSLLPDCENRKIWKLLEQKSNLGKFCTGTHWISLTGMLRDCVRVRVLAMCENALIQLKSMLRWKGIDRSIYEISALSAGISDDNFSSFNN